MSLIRQIIKDRATVYTNTATQPAHIVLSSGQHSNGYINFDPATVDTQAMWYLAGELARTFLEQLPLQLDSEPLGFTGLGKLTVISPPWGSTRLADYFALQLQILTGEKVYMAIVEKNSTGDFFIDREGHKEALSSASVVIIEDVITTGNSTLKAITLAEGYGGTVLAIGSVWNRGGVTASDLTADKGSVLMFSLVNQKIEDWEVGECPLCAMGVPIATDLGHGAKFQSNYPGYPGGFTTLRNR